MLAPQISLIPPYFHLWHLPVVFVAGLIGEGYGVITGSASILIQFALASLGMPITSVIATDLAGCIGATAGVIVTSTSPRQIWDKRKLFSLLAIPFFLGGIIGTIFLIYIPPTILKYILIIALPLLLWRTLTDKRAVQRKIENFYVRPRQYPIIFPALTAIGLYNNVSGIGSGTFLRLFFVSFLRMGVADSICVINIITLPAYIFSLALTAAAGLIAWPYCVTLWLGTFIGGKYAMIIARKVPNQYLRGLLVVVVLLYLIWLLISLWHG